MDRLSAIRASGDPPSPGTDFLSMRATTSAETKVGCLVPPPARGLPTATRACFAALPLGDAPAAVAGALLPGNPAVRRGTEFRRGAGKPLLAVITPLAAACGPANTSVPPCSAAAAPTGRLATAAEDRDTARPEFVLLANPTSAFSRALGSVPCPAPAADDNRVGPAGAPADDAGLDGPLTLPFASDRGARPFVLRPTAVPAGPTIMPSPFFVTLPPAALTPTSLAVVPTASALRPSPRPVVAGCPLGSPIAG